MIAVHKPGYSFLLGPHLEGSMAVWLLESALCSCSDGLGTNSGSGLSQPPLCVLTELFTVKPGDLNK